MADFDTVVISYVNTDATNTNVVDMTDALITGNDGTGSTKAAWVVASGADASLRVIWGSTTLGTSFTEVEIAWHIATAGNYKLIFEFPPSLVISGMPSFSNQYASANY